MKVHLIALIVISLLNRISAQHEDCPLALLICNKNLIQLDSFNSSGKMNNEALGTCLGEGGGMAFDSYSKWLFWQAENDGSLTFEITPQSVDSDIDFALYEIEEGIKSCAQRKVLRCNATAPNCCSVTGLSLTDNDITENFNCDAGENGFCKFINMNKSHYYALFISNFAQEKNSKVTITWGGTGLFVDACSNRVDDLLDLNELVLLSNPVNDNLVINNSFQYFSSRIKFSIIDTKSIVHTTMLRNPEATMSLDVQNLSSGIYFLICHEGNKKPRMIKFMKY